MSGYNGRMEECSGANEVEVVDLVGYSLITKSKYGLLKKGF